MIGIIVSIYCWRHTWHEVRSLRELKRFDIFQENGFSTFGKRAKEYIESTKDAPPPFSLDGPGEEVLKASIYNLIQNTRSEEEQ